MVTRRPAWGSARLHHQYRVDLDEVRQLRVGQCFGISRGLAMKLQIAPAPSQASLHQLPQPHPVSVAVALAFFLVRRDGAEYGAAAAIATWLLGHVGVAWARRA
jgi:hypothetical protein